MKRRPPRSTLTDTRFPDTTLVRSFEYGAVRLGADLKRGPLMDLLTNLQNFDTGIGAVINTRDTARIGEGDPTADHLGMGQFMMLQICDNRLDRKSTRLNSSH